MDERNTANLVPPAIDHRGQDTRSPSPGGLTTADLAASGESADRATGQQARAPLAERREQGIEPPDVAQRDRERREVERQDTVQPGAAQREVGQPTRGGGTVAPGGGVTAQMAEQGQGASQGASPLFAAGDAQRFREQWNEVQTGFVDDPRRAVEQADHTVAEVMKRLAEVFAEERAKLEQQWSKGDNVSTEDLRVTLQRYRSFFTRLLSV
jgi:hypothetical protein